MYKQTVYGFRSPIVAGIFEAFLFLLYTAFIELVWGTEYSSILYYVGVTAVFLLLSIYIFIVTITKYEYAILDNELFVRKFINGKLHRIYAVKLVRSNCVYCNKGLRYLTTSAKETVRTYIPGFDIFNKRCAVVFSDRDGIRRKLILKPDKQLDEEIFRIKTTKW